MTELSYDHAALLLRRIGFGGTPEEIEELSSRGREAAVDHLLNYERTDNSSLESLLSRQLLNPEKSAGDTSERDGRLVTPYESTMRRWWITRMVISKRPVEEKLTLFWHNYFATALQKVPDRLMFLQNKTLRKHALDRFDTLLLKVAQDPAMMVWLDTVTNTLGSPNENFGRELMELFTMGITDVVTGEPNYNEKDVKEVSRAFTGWSFKTAGKNRNKYKFIIRKKDHDNGSKEVFGQVANYTGEDIITIIAARRETARYLVSKFFESFVYPMSESAEDKSTIEKFAQVYIESDHSIKALTQAIFTSNEFYTERARTSLIKTPADFLVGPLRMLGGQFDPLGPWSEGFRYTTWRLLGMDLFNPPDVGGWKLNLGWVNTATLIARFNAANLLATFRPPIPRLIDFLGLTTEVLRRHVRATPADTVENFLKILGPLPVGTEVKAMLSDYLQTDDEGNRVEFIADDQTINKNVRGLLYLILCMEEFQLY